MKTISFFNCYGKWIWKTLCSPRVHGEFSINIWKTSFSSLIEKPHCAGERRATLSKSVERSKKKNLFFSTQQGATLPSVALRSPKGVGIVSLYFNLSNKKLSATAFRWNHLFYGGATLYSQRLFPFAPIKQKHQQCRLVCFRNQSLSFQAFVIIDRKKKWGIKEGTPWWSPPIDLLFFLFSLQTVTGMNENKKKWHINNENKVSTKESKVSTNKGKESHARFCASDREWKFNKGRFSQRIFQSFKRSYLYWNNSRPSEVAVSTKESFNKMVSRDIYFAILTNALFWTSKGEWKVPNPYGDLALSGAKAPHFNG